jgi:hypothetical protein
MASQPVSKVMKSKLRNGENNERNYRSEGVQMNWKTA